MRDYSEAPPTTITTAVRLVLHSKVCFPPTITIQRDTEPARAIPAGSDRPKLNLTKRNNLNFLKATLQGNNANTHPALCILAQIIVKTTGLFGDMAV